MQAFLQKEMSSVHHQYGTIRRCQLDYILSTPECLNFANLKCQVVEMCKVNSVREACVKCFAVHILKFKILQITWKKWNQEHQTLVFQFLIARLARSDPRNHFVVGNFLSAVCSNLRVFRHFIEYFIIF